MAIKKTLVFAFIILACISVLYSQDQNKEKSGISADTITAICGIIIAGLALFLTYWQAREIRKHNKLSLRPHLDIYWFFDPAKDSGIIIVNRGLGTAILKKVRCVLDGKKQKIPNDGTLFDLIEKLELGAYNRFSATIRNNKAFSPGEKKKLITFKTDSEFDKAEKQLKRINIVIDYESLYGESFTASLYS